MTASFDGIVIGTGIIGTGIALALARRGRRVLALDKNPAAGYGSTSSSSAIIRTFYSTHAGCALAWEGLQIWRDWQGFLGAGDDEALARMIPCAGLILRTGAADGLETICAHHDRLGIPWQALDAAALKARFPALDLTGYAPPRRLDDAQFGVPSGRDVTGAILFPQSGYVTDPQLAARNMQTAAERHGATFRFNARVTQILRDDGRVAGVRLESGETLMAPVVVNAAGPYSRQINQLAGTLDDMTLTTRPLRQEVCHLPFKDGFAEPVMIGDADTGGYMRTELGGDLLVGGMEPACDPLHFVDDPDRLDRNLTEQWTVQAHRAGLRLPTIGIPNTARGVADLYDVTEDWNPIYDRSSLAGFYLAIGTSGNQFKNGPVAGELMAALIDYQEGGNDHDRAPCLFPLARTGSALDLSVFSRRREPLLDGGNVLG